MADAKQYAKWLVQNQDKQGTDEYKTVASAYKKLRAPTKTDPENQMPEPTFLESTGRGMMDVYQGVRQVLPEGMGGYSPEQEEEVRREVERYEQGQGDSFDWGRVTGQAAATAPLMAVPASQAGLMARTGAGAAAGGAGAGVLYADAPGERAINVGTGALAGGTLSAAAPAVADKAGKLYAGAKNLFGKMNNLIEDPKVSLQITNQIDDAARNLGLSLDDISESARAKIVNQARQMLKNEGSIDAEALARKAASEKFGFVDDAAMTAGQATRNPQLYSQEKNLSKRAGGDALAERFNNQLAVIDNYMERIKGSKALSQEEIGDLVEQAVKRKSELMQGEVRQAYNQLPKGVELPRDALESRLSPILDDFEDSVSAGVKRRISQLLDSESKRPLNSDELIKLDKLITETMPGGADRAQSTAASKLKTELLGVLDDAAEISSPEDVVGAVIRMPDGKEFIANNHISASQKALQSGYSKADIAGAADAGFKTTKGRYVPREEAVQLVGDAKNADQSLAPIYKRAKQAAAKRFAQVGDQRKLTGKLAAGTMDPEDVTRKITSGKIRESRQLFNFLDDDAKEVVRSGVRNKIYDSAYNGEEFSQAGLNRAIEKIGKNRLKMILGEDEANRIFEFAGITRAMRHYPAEHSINVSGTAAEAERIGGDYLGAAIDSLPGGRLANLALRDAGEEASKKQTRSLANILLNFGDSGAKNPVTTYLPEVRGASSTVPGLLGVEAQRN